MDRTVDDPLLGRVLDGRYEVGRRVARGGMATVYEAVDLRLQRTVAIKVMHPGLAEDTEYADRFQREARSAARLSHPNVVSVFDQGEDQGTLFLVMEYVPGRTLRDLLRTDGRQSTQRALALLEPVLSALAAAHRLGLVHRDVKPENVLISDDGQLKVADFGLSRTISGETQHTATGAVLIGTVSYLAPELVTEGRGDARADVYAVGVLLFELLTGRKPHQGESPIQVAWRHVHEDVAPPSSLVPGIAPYVDALVARATARDPSARAADAGVLLHQVRRVRHAAEQGLADDPELTADLSPTRAVTSTVDDGFGPEVDGSDDRDRDVADPAVGPVVGQVPPTGTGELWTTSRPEPTSTLARTSTSDRRPPTGPSRSRRRRALLPVALVVALLLGVGAWWFGIGRFASTPAVVTLAAGPAQQRVEDAGLGWRVSDRAYSETVRAGRVLRQTPGANDRIDPDGTVAVVLSRGPERHAVPDVVGQPLDEAQATLRSGRLGFGESIARFNATVPDGSVVRADPEVGTELRRDAAVDLVVSRGPRPIDVPDVTGLARARAEAEVVDLDLQAEVEETFDDQVPEGRVVSQSPAGGTLVAGDTVTLTVSKGPELVAVPAVKGAGVAAARRTLEGAGFTVRTEQSPVYVGLQYVLDTDPSAGTLVPKGSTITLVLV